MVECEKGQASAIMDVHVKHEVMASSSSSGSGSTSRVAPLGA
jgi:hypothetical protein